MLTGFTIKFKLDAAADAILRVLVCIVLAKAHRIDQCLVMARTRLLRRSEILGQSLRRVKVAAGHFLRNLRGLLVDTEVIWRHVHISDCHERAAHIDTDGRALVRMIIVVIIAHFADVRGSTSARWQILHALYVFARVRGLLLVLGLMARVGFAATRSSELAL